MNMRWIGGLVLPAAVLVMLAGGPAHADEKHPGEAAFAARVAKDHGVSASHIRSLLDQAERQQAVIDAMRKPAESLPWPAYRKIFLTRLRIAGGVAFYRNHKALLDRIGDEYGVDPQYIVAILGVETNYGTRTGSYRVLDALATLAFHYPPRQTYFRRELEKFLTMPLTQLPGPRVDIKGSYAGAMGWGQFMPSSVAAYARDEDGDGHIDLIKSLPDILASVANYLAQHGWQHGQPVAVVAARQARAERVQVKHSKPVYSMGGLEAKGYTPERKVAADTPATLLKLDGKDGAKYWFTFKNFHVITRYNHSPMYAMAVTQLAGEILAGARQAAGDSTAGRQDTNSSAPQAGAASR